jgi:hypothetical protein
MAEAFTKISGLWIDPITNVSGRLNKSESAKVGATVRMLTNEVIDEVNNAYSFNPPLKRSDMLVDQYTGKLYMLYFLFF